MEERAYISWTVVCCLLDVCGLWLCLPPISVFGVVRMPTGPPVNAPYRLATPEGTAAAENPWEGVEWMRCIHQGKWEKVSVQARHLAYIHTVCVHVWWHDTMILCMTVVHVCTVCVYAEGSGLAAVTIHLTGLELPAALPRLTSPLATIRFPHVVPLRPPGAPATVCRQPLRPQGGSGAGEGPTGWICSRLNNPHYGTHLIASNWCLMASLVPDCPWVNVLLPTDHYWPFYLEW